MLATVRSATLVGVWGHPVLVEVHVADGLPGFTVVGLPDASCREARDRVRAAIVSSKLGWPMKRITVNLAPSDVPKSGAGLDLAIAVGVLVADEQLEAASIADTGVLGQLGLDGSVRPVPGALPLVDAMDHSSVIVAARDSAVAALVARDRVRPVGALRQLFDALAGTAPWPEPPAAPRVVPPEPEPDLADIAGQPLARWALEVAAAGGHHLLLVGPPGAGKTMLARRLVGLLPDLSTEVALEVTRVHSAAGAGAARRPDHSTSVQGSPSFVVDGRPGGRRHCPGPTRRGERGHRRRALSGRARRVRAVGAERAAPAAGGGHDPGGPLTGHGGAPGPVPAGGRHEPLPLRLGRHGRLPLRSGSAGPLPAPPVRPLRGPPRSRGPSGPPRSGRSAGRRAEHRERRGGRAGGERAQASPTARRQEQQRADRCGPGSARPPRQGRYGGVEDRPWPRVVSVHGDCAGSAPWPVRSGTSTTAAASCGQPTCWPHSR